MRKIFFLLFIALAQVGWSALTINGTIKNAKGDIPKFADAHILEFGVERGQPLKSVHADKSGRFTLTLEDGKYYTLVITAADHQGLNIPILSDNKNQTFKIEIQLEANNYKETFDEVKIIGDWNKFNFRNAEKMERQDDGTFKYSVKSGADKVAYQLLGLDTDGHSVNGTMNDDFEYDGGGDYRSIVKVSNGVVDIIFEPQKVFRSTKTDQPKIIFKNNGPMNTIIKINKIANKAESRFAEARNDYYSKNKNLDGFEFSFTELKPYLLAFIENDNNLISRYAAARYIKIVTWGNQKTESNKIVNLLSVTDPMWGLEPFAMVSILNIAYGEEEAEKIIRKEFDNIPSQNVKAKTLVMLGMQAKSKNNMDEVARIYKLLTSNYPEQKEELRWYLGELDPNKAITKGKQVPAFNVQLIHSDEMVSRESMLGKYYLMDFWAVWCGPCRAEMPNIHEAYKKFKDKNFQILSLSFDPKVSAVDEYRKDTWPMPWLHTFVEKGFKNELSKRFEVNGIPKPILVNDKGIIIATGSELRGSALKKTLSKFLNEAM